MQSGAFVCGCRQAAGKTNLSKLICQHLLDNGIILHILDSSRAWDEFPVPVIRMPGDYTSVEANFAASQTFDMAELTHAQREAVANQVCGIIYRHHVQDGCATPEAVIFEEAQTYFYNGCSRTKTNYNPAMDYLTIGGNFNLSFLMITQFPALVDKTFVKAAQQRYFGLSTEKNDTSYIKGFIENEDSKRLKEQLGIKSKAFITKFLQRGQFVYQNRGHVEVFRCGKYEPPKSAPQNFNYTFSYTV
jgi:hypothetical protein